ncbi:hypothetical protein U8P75_04350 [Rhizobium beringeri]|nr:hypothetical protein U8P75_04350 [Rhizobium beringeri]
MADLPRPRVAWISPQLNYLLASTRYRCYYPVLALRELEIESVFYKSSKEAIPHLKELDAIVFVKHLDRESLKLAGLAKDQGVKVLIDLCDNIVVANYPMAPDFHPALRLAGIGAFADAIVVPSPALAEALKPLLRSGVCFVVIPDQVETRRASQRPDDFRSRSRRLPRGGPSLSCSVPRGLFFIWHAIPKTRWQSSNGRSHWCTGSSVCAW